MNESKCFLCVVTCFAYRLFLSKHNCDTESAGETLRDNQRRRGGAWCVVSECASVLSKVIYQSLVMLVMWQISSLCKTTEMPKLMVDSSRQCQIVCKILYDLPQVRTSNRFTSTSTQVL